MWIAMLQTTAEATATHRLYSAYDFRFLRPEKRNISSNTGFDIGAPLVSGRVVSTLRLY
jgi:hypothetical protein